MPTSIHPERDEHREAEELLPWYATGQLDAADRTLVDSHLASCAACQRQVAMERRLIDEFHELVPEMDSGWARIRDRIDPRARVPGPRLRLQEFWASLGQAFRQPIVATLATAQIAFVVVAGSLLMLSRPAYQALGSGSAPANANAIIMFRADATDEDMRSALRNASASMVAGPTSAGAWLLHVDPARRQQALAKLRSNEEVQLAEAIDGPSK